MEGEMENYNNNPGMMGGGANPLYRVRHKLKFSHSKTMIMHLYSES